MKRLAVYMKPYIVFFLVAPIFKAVEASAGLLQPKIMTATVNAGIVAGDVSVIWRNGLLLLGVALVGIVGGVGACCFAAKSSQGFGADLRRACSTYLLLGTTSRGAALTARACIRNDHRICSYTARDVALPVEYELDAPVEAARPGPMGRGLHRKWRSAGLTEGTRGQSGWSWDVVIL